jgi:DNA-binding FadR family transcriptional regulator
MEWYIHDKERISDKLAVEIFASILSEAIPARSRLPTLETLLKKTNASI